LFPVDPSTGEQSLDLPQDCSMILISRTAPTDDVFGNAIIDRVPEALGLARFSR